MKTLALAEMTIVGILFLMLIYQKGENRILKEVNTKMEATILHMKETLNKMSPNHCTVMLPGGMICWEPASHLFAGSKICDSCKEKLAIMAPSPPPLPIIA